MFTDHPHESVCDGEPDDPMRSPVFQAIVFVHEHARARATGCWRFEPGRLRLEAFLACPEMKPEVATGFPVATADVPVTDTGLGIVLAARTREVTEYRAIDLPPDSGSGFWLRGFEADRSIAVPQLDDAGNLVRILSVAVEGLEEPIDTYARIVRQAFERFLPLDRHMSQDFPVTSENVPPG
jgi:hypothetical protein